jgi:hypothetical protein
VKKHILEKMRDVAYGVALSGQGVGPRYAFRHGAVLFDRSGKIVSAKSNSLKTHPKLARSLTIRISMLSLRVSSVTVWITVMALVSWF